MIWSCVQRFGTMGISFISNMVLARLLTPDDFGCIGMLMIFIALSNTFIDGGFGSALIQKNEPTQVDYSTIFYWNIFLSILLYGLLYVCSPLIADFYRIPMLSDVLRIQGVVLIINAFSVIQSNQLRKQLKFKKLASINVAASLFSVVIAIVGAWKGYGVWSLVAQQLAFSCCVSFFLWVFNKWHPLFVFSKESFKELFGFGSYILMSNILNTFFGNLNSLMIGRFFSAAIMGNFTQAKRIEDISSTSIINVIEQVSYPILVEVKNDKQAMQNIIKKFNVSLLYIIMPLMLVINLLALPIVVLLFSFKWIPAVPFLQILVFQGIALCMQGVNYNAIASIGESKVLFRSIIIKRVVYFLSMLGGVCVSGMNGLLWGMTISSFFAAFYNAVLVDKFIGYKFINQIKDLMPTIFISLFSFLLVFLLKYFFTMDLYIGAFCWLMLYLLLYIGISYMFKIKVLFMLGSIILNRFHK